MEMFKISDVLSGDACGKRFDGFYIMSSAEVKSGANGKQFLNCTLTDKTGSISAKMWDYIGTIHEDAGKVVKIRARADEYQGNPQVIIDMIRLTTEQDTFQLDDLVPSAPFEMDTMTHELATLLGGITDQDYVNVTVEIYNRYADKFLTIPAAKKVHHAFLRGLLMHTLSIMKMCNNACEIYPFVNKSLLLTGAFLHDIGKIEEFTCSELGLVTDYSKSGKLLGHLVMGAMIVRDICKEQNVPEDKALMLEHMLVSHHGEPEFGAAVRPLFVEAEILSQIDMLDAKVEIYRETTETMQSGAFSDKVFPLGGRSIMKT